MMKISPRQTPPTARAQMPIGTGLMVAGLLAVATGLILPLLIGSFSGRQQLILALVELACLLLLGVGAVLMARQLRTSHAALWALARRDELTGVGNYRGLHERLAEEIGRHRRHGAAFALIIFDLDGFKQVNEAHGHLVGDRLLARVGEILDEEVRLEDAVFRQGGDEFAVIAPATDAAKAGELAARLRSRLRERGLAAEGTPPVTAQTGVAIFPIDGRTIDDLLGYADRGLFAAKRERALGYGHA